MNRRQINDCDAILEFMFAGRAVFTLLSTASGTRFTYRIKQSDDGKVFFVSLRSGPDRWTYMGIIGTNFNRQPTNLYQTIKSRVSVDTLSWRAFDWFYERLQISHKSLNYLEFWHEGHCGRCNRELTVPESIDRGLGPKCAEIMGVS